MTNVIQNCNVKIIDLWQSDGLCFVTWWVNSGKPFKHSDFIRVPKIFRWSIHTTIYLICANTYLKTFFQFLFCYISNQIITVQIQCQWEFSNRKYHLQEDIGKYETSWHLVEVFLRKCINQFQRYEFLKSHFWEHFCKKIENLDVYFSFA